MRPIRCRWEDFDREMQGILRSYDRGDVKPTGGHIRAWNEQMRRRQRNLQTVVSAAQKYKRALQDERRATGRGPVARGAEAMPGGG